MVASPSEPLALRTQDLPDTYEKILRNHFDESVLGWREIRLERRRKDSKSEESMRSREIVTFDVVSSLDVPRAMSFLLEKLKYTPVEKRGKKVRKTGKSSYQVLTQNPRHQSHELLLLVVIRLESLRELRVRSDSELLPTLTEQTRMGLKASRDHSNRTS